MKKETIKKAGKIAGYTIAGIAFVAAAAATVLFVVVNKPAEAKKCFRATHRANGAKKVAFKTPLRANLQSAKQFWFYGEVYNPYKVGKRYYTGHSKFAPIRSIKIA